MKRSTGIAVFMTGMLLSAVHADDAENPWVIYTAAKKLDQGKHVVLVSGDEEYRSEEALPMLGQILSQRHGFRCTVLFAIDPESGTIDPENQNHIPGLEALAKADMLVLFTRFRELPDEDMRHIVEYVESGKPLLGIRTATHAFAYRKESKSKYARWSYNSREWPGGFGRQILGETWVNHHGHHGKESTRGVIAKGQERHPILKGVREIWGPTDVYGIRDLPKDAVTLVEGSVRAGMKPESPAVEGKKNGPQMPIIWIRERRDAKSQRVICSTIGASVDMKSEGLRRALVNACYWGMGLEAKIPDKSDVRYVRDYEPTAFGFGKARKGVKPRDLQVSPEPTKKSGK